MNDYITNLDRSVIITCCTTAWRLVLRPTQVFLSDAARRFTICYHILLLIIGSCGQFNISQIILQTADSWPRQAPTLRRLIYLLRVLFIVWSQNIII